MEYVVFLQPALAALTALAVMFYLVRAVRRRDMGYARRAAAYGVLGMLVISSLVVTGPGHRGVVFSQSGGIQERERVEGISFVIPWVQSAVQMDVRTQKFFTNEAFAQSSDLQEITVHVAVNYHVDPTLAAELYRDVGRDYEEVVIRPAVFQLVKEAVGQILAVDFATNRESLAADIHDNLAGRLAGVGILVEFVAIEDAVFDPDFIKAVKNKVIANEKVEEQLRLVAEAEHRASQAVKTAEGVKAAAILEGQGVAEKNRLINESLTGDLLTWTRLLEWSGNLPQTYIGGDEPLDAIIDLP